MPAWSFAPDDLVPHRAPMILFDRVVAFDAETRSLETEVTIRPDSPFAETDGVPSWCAIEYMAQAAAALAGAADRAAGVDNSARPGFLLGTRRLTLDLPRFSMGERYRVAAQAVFSDGDAAAFACRIADAAGRTVAQAVLNAYRPPDAAAFLREGGSASAARSDEERT